MTASEIQALRNEYAMEDLELLKNSGYMCVTDTKHGVISLQYEDGIFKAFNNLGHALIGNLNEEGFVNWLSQQYTEA